MPVRVERRAKAWRVNDGYAVPDTGSELIFPCATFRAHDGWKRRVAQLVDQMRLSMAELAYEHNVPTFHGDR